jgi:hypothetical protein
MFCCPRIQEREIMYFREFVCLRSALVSENSSQPEVTHVFDILHIWSFRINEN